MLNFSGRLIAGIAILGMGFAGCDQKSTSKPTKPTTVEIKTPAAKAMTFTKDEFSKTTMTDELSNYTIDMRIKSADFVFDNNYTNDNPPMPFVTGSIAGYQLENGYTVFFGNSRRKLVGGDPMEWTRLTIVGDNGLATLYINGERVASGYDDTAITGLIQLGRGFQDRYWAGEYSHFDIYSGNALPTEFAGSKDRLKGDRIFSLESFE